MNYYLYPPFFGIEPQTSFDNAWEVFCCELLNLEYSTHEIRRRTPPDLGADLIWDQKGIVYQCKSTQGSLNLSEIKKSIDKAKENQNILGWHRYILCTNVNLTGDQEQKLRDHLPIIEFLNCDYWTKLCRNFRNEVEVSNRFRFQQTNAPALSQIWNVPYRLNLFFTGQENIIAKIHYHLHTTKTAALTQSQAITGLGGIGKTQIAVEYVYRYRDEYQAVLWVGAATRETIIADFMKIADVLRLSEEIEYEQERVVDSIKQWLTQHSGWLLIFDNADDLAMVCDFLPTGGKGHLLLTTRDQATGNIANSIEVEKMNKEDGTLFLLKRAKIITLDTPLTAASAENRVTAEEIVAIMGGLPLALEQVGAYVEETKCSLSRYLELYQAQQLEMLERKSRLPNDYPKSVATTWLLSFDQVRQINSDVAELLRFCAFFHPDSIPEEVIAVGHPMKIDEEIAVLLKFSLVHRNSDTQTLSIHRLVQTVLIYEMDEETRTRWAELAVRVLERFFPREAKVTTWALCQRYLPHAFVSADLIEKYDLMFAESARLLHIVGYYLQETAHYEEARQFYERALNIFTQAQGPEHCNTAATLHELARLSHTQGKYKDAEKLYEKVLHIYEDTLQLEHPNVAATQHELGRLFLTLERYDEAQHLLNKALSMREQTLGSENPDTAATLHELAVLYQHQKQYKDAEQLLHRVLNIEGKMLGLNHPDTANTMHSLAVVYEEQEQYEQAKSLYEQALGIEEQTLGPEHPKIVGTLNNLAILHQRQKHYKQAQSLYERALYIYEQKLGSDHPIIITILSNLAMVHGEQEEFEQAKSCYERALNLCNKVLEPDHPDTAIIMGQLAQLYVDQKHYDQAESLCKQVLSILEKTPEPEPGHLIIILQILTELYLAQDKYKQAEQVIQRVVDIEEVILGPSDPNFASGLQLLAMIYMLQGIYNKARPLFERILNIYEKTLGPKNPKTLAARKEYSSLTHQSIHEKNTTNRRKKRTNSQHKRYLKRK